MEGKPAELSVIAVGKVQQESSQAWPQALTEEIKACVQETVIAEAKGPKHWE